MTSPHASRIQALPKAERHVPIEGTCKPELLLVLARCRGMPMPYPDVDTLRAAYGFRNLHAFLDL